MAHIDAMHFINMGCRLTVDNDVSVTILVSMTNELLAKLQNPDTIDLPRQELIELVLAIEAEEETISAIVTRDEAAQAGMELEQVQDLVDDLREASRVLRRRVRELAEAMR